MNLLRPFLAAALLCTGLMTSPTPSLAQAVPQVYVTAPRAGAHALLPDTLDGDYRFTMANGRTMNVAFAGPDTLHLRYGRHLRSVLKAEGPGRFVSRDGQIRLVFELDAQGRVHQVQLTLPTGSA
ncbi:MAG: hypothetical protein H6933_08690 [Burkholderiaceae bacterium]|nr:hypothetical protein [Rhodoferax sp.]MCP5284963.1 hypothetical protein [Burkholderiaceae bacterium]